MFNFGIIIFSIFLSFVLNLIVVKIIGTLDYEVLGLKNKSTSVIKIYSHIFSNKKLMFRFIILGVIFIFLNYVILIRIVNNFSLVLFQIYIRYYYLFLVLYIFALIDYITYYIYTLLSYPLIIFSLVTFVLSFLNIGNFRSNLETLILIGFLYIIINKFKFLGEGDFDILLIIALTLGVLPTVFIFYLSIVMSGLVGMGILFKNSFKIKNNKLAFVPFIFISTTLFIILRV